MTTQDLNALNTQDQTNLRQDLITAVLSAYPGATRFNAGVLRDENNPGHHTDDSWSVQCGETIIATQEDDESNSAFGHELSEYIDHLHLPTDFSLDLTPPGAGTQPTTPTAVQGNLEPLTAVQAVRILGELTQCGNGLSAEQRALLTEVADLDDASIDDVLHRCSALWDRLKDHIGHRAPSAEAMADFMHRQALTELDAQRPTTRRFTLDVDELARLNGTEGLNDHLQALIDHDGLGHTATDVSYAFVGPGVVEASYTPEWFMN